MKCLAETLNKGHTYFGSQFEDETCFGGGSHNSGNVSSCHIVFTVKRQKEDAGWKRRKVGRRRDADACCLSPSHPVQGPAHGIVLPIFNMSSHFKLL